MAGILKKVNNAPSQFSFLSIVIIQTRSKTFVDNRNYWYGCCQESSSRSYRTVRQDTACSGQNATKCRLPSENRTNCCSPRSNSWKGIFFLFWNNLGIFLYFNNIHCRTPVCKRLKRKSVADKLKRLSFKLKMNCCWLVRCLGGSHGNLWSVQHRPLNGNGHQHKLSRWLTNKNIRNVELQQTKMNKQKKKRI